MSVREPRSPEARARRAAQRNRQIGNQQRAKAKPLVADAAERRVVRLADGRTGRLLRVPAQSSVRSSGAKARVELPSGAVISVPVGELTVIA